MSYESYRGQGPPQPQQYAQYNPYDGMQQRGSSNYDTEQGQGGYEMQSNVNGGADRILNECRAVDSAIDDLEYSLQGLTSLRERFLNAQNPADEAPLKQQVDQKSQEIMDQYRGLVARVKRIKENRESGNPRNVNQVGKVDRRLKAAINRFQQADSAYNKQSREGFKRQYMIVRPDASEQEVAEALENPNSQVFSQALLNSNRRGQAQSTRSNVEARHLAVQQIERQMIELSQLFQDLDNIVVQQEPAVTQIEQKGEEVQRHVDGGITHLDQGVKKARAARRKKWICFGIVVAIIAVIIIIILVVLAVQKKLG